MRDTTGYKGFSSWTDLLAAVASGARIWYWAPMDYRPSSVHVIKIFKNGNLRIDPLSNQASKFTADKGHLDRFFVRA